MKWVFQTEETAFSTLKKKKGELGKQKHEHGTEWLEQSVLEGGAELITRDFWVILRSLDFILRVKKRFHGQKCQASL